MFPWPALSGRELVDNCIVGYMTAYQIGLRSGLIFLGDIF